MNTEVIDNYSSAGARDTWILLTIFRVMIAFSIVGCALASVFGGDNQQEILVGLIGTAILIIASIPLFVRKDYSLFEPATFVILLVLFGTPLKLLYAIATYNEDKHVAKLLMNFEYPEFFIPALVTVAIGWVCFVIGYQLKIPRSPVEHLFMPRRNAWDGRSLQLVMLILVVVSITCFVGFIVTAGVSFSSLSGMSSKRFSDEAGSAASRIHSVKYFLYRGAAISKFLVYLGIIWLLSRRKSFVSWTGALIAFAFFQTVFLSFVMSNRAGVVLVMLDCLVIFFYMRNTLNLKALLTVFGLSVLLLIPMLAGRAKEESTGSGLIKKTLAGRDLLDITKTCHIINGVPAKMDYLYGETLWGWMAAPVPSSMWESKPMWAGKGPFINQHIFHDKAGISGVPPGLIAELYWNFGYLGVFLGMFSLGALLRHLFNSFRPYIGNPSSVLIYTLVVTRFGMFALGSDLGTGIVKTLLDLVPVMAILWFIGVKDYGAEYQTEYIQNDAGMTGYPANMPAANFSTEIR